MSSTSGPYRYVALIHDEANAQQLRVACELAASLLANGQWGRLIDLPGLSVFEAGGQGSSLRGKVLEGSTGVVLGRIFRPGVDCSREVTRFDPDESRRIVSTRGGHLLRSYWGGYVAVLSDEPARAFHVLRDPSGNLPCFYVQHHGVQVLVSRPTECLNLGMTAPSIEWTCVPEYLHGRGLLLDATCLHGVRELHPGQRLRIAPGKVCAELAWSPRELACDPCTTPAGELVARLASVLRSCVQSHALCHEGVLHTLSGGLDSSVVAACLHERKPRWRTVCINYVTEGSEGDERDFARAAAAKARLDLLEHQLDSDQVRLDRILAIEPGARPHSYRYHVEHTPVEAEFASRYRLGAIVGGGGGDGLFGRSVARLAVEDFLRLRSLRPQLWMTAWDAARVEQRSIWSILADGVRATRGHSDGLLPLDVDTNPLLTREALAATRTLRPAHPWVDDAACLPAGKQFHILTMSVPPFFYDPLGGADHPERVHPLVSQPLIELLLPIPTYQLIQNGWDRSLVRQAFADDLPPEIVCRRSKGRVGEHTRRLILANRAFVQETLHEGLLVREGLLAPLRLEKVLSKAAVMTARECSALEELLSIEAWVRRWEQLRAEGNARTTR